MTETHPLETDLPETPLPERRKAILTRRRVIRWGIYAVLLVIVLTQFQRFGCSRIGSEAALAMHPVLSQGKSYLVDDDPGELLMRDSIVLWFTRDKEGQAEPHYSRIRGIPGDRLKRVGETWAFEDGAGESHYLPRDLGVTEMARLVDGRLASDQYYLLNDNLSVDMPDSRTLGWIERPWIRARIIPSIFGGTR